MTKEEAKNILRYHSFTHEDINHPRTKRGFLGMLRPFLGELVEKNYHEVMGAIKVLADDLREEDKVDREIVSTIWSICHLTRSWAIQPGGMLRRNNLIKKEQVKKLEDWVEAISYTTMMILDGSDNQTAFEFYQDE